MTISPATGGEPAKAPTSSRVARAARLNLIAGTVLLVLKLAAWLATGSVALLADALESIVNVAAAFAADWAVRLARRPPDARHPFGHSKAEYLSAVLEGTLVLVAAGGIVQQSWGQLRDPQPPDALGLGLALAVAAALATAALALYLGRTGRAEGSPALQASAAHLWGDVLTTVGVLVGLVAAWATGWWRLDPLIAILVAVNIVRLGVAVVRDSVGGLMDEALPAEEVERIGALATREMGGALQIHGLRTRRAGHGRFVELHLVVPDAMPVVEAHAICDRIEAAIEEEMPGTQVVVHVEPEAELQGDGRRSQGS